MVRTDSAELDGPREAAASLLTTAEAAMTQPTEAMVHDWLAELSVLAPKRADDVLTEALRIRAYTSRLMAYPADVVRAAMLDRSWPFFPSWDELRQECEALVRERVLILVAARRAAAVPIAAPPREIVTEAQKAAILREMGMTEDRLTVQPKRMDAAPDEAPA